MAVTKSAGASSLAEVLDHILERGLVIDIWAQISIVGIQLITIEARIIVSSIETYLVYAEAVGLTVRKNAMALE